MTAASETTGSAVFPDAELRSLWYLVLLTQSALCVAYGVYLERGGWLRPGSTARA